MLEIGISTIELRGAIIASAIEKGFINASTEI